MSALAIATLVTWTLVPPAALAQGIDGYVSVFADVFPAPQRETGEREAVYELRARVFAERRIMFGERLRLTAAGFVEGLAADRNRGDTVKSAIVRPQELHVEAVWAKGDLRAGMSRAVWGRLDELQPTDVVNPLDFGRFFFEGRSEGRIAVPMIRGRLVPSDRLAIEAIYVPIFTRGRFDQLDEATSPFNLAPQTTTCVAVASRSCPPLVTPALEPRREWRNAQGGARASVTSGRVDWSVSAYRGFEPLPLYELSSGVAVDPLAPTDVLAILARFPRFTMIGGDFETVRGEWGVRGEVASFVDRTLQSTGLPGSFRGKTVEGGVGVDRKAGSYRLSGNAVVARRWSSDAARVPPLAGRSPQIDRSDVTLVGSIDRSFARETRTVRTFAVYNPGEGSVFARVIVTSALRDDVSLELSGGLFSGDGVDAISRLASRDFVYARFKVFF